MAFLSLSMGASTHGPVITVKLRDGIQLSEFVTKSEAATRLGYYHNGA